MADDYRMLIGGDWVASESGATFDATSPSTGEVIGSIPEGTRGDAQRAIAAANEAWPAWSGLSAFDRAAAMRRIAAAIDGRREDLARTLALDQGKPLAAEARDEVEELIAYFDMAAADATRMEGLIPPSIDAGKRVFLYRVSRGVVGVISPWNWPYTMPAEIVAPALAAGNAVVLAPAPTTSVCAVKLAECIEAADLPAGRLQPGDGSRAGRRRRGGGQRRDGRRRVHRVDRDRAHGGVARRRQGAPAGDGRERAPRGLSTMPTSTLRSRPPSPPAS